MQLKFKRSSYEKKIFLGSKTRYRLEALLDLTPEERPVVEQGMGGYLQYLALGGDPTQGAKMGQWRVSDERKLQDYGILKDAYNMQLLSGLTIEADTMGQIQQAEEGITKAVKAWKFFVFANQDFAHGSERIIDI